jgi:hypothetical protein
MESLLLTPGLGVRFAGFSRAFDHACDSFFAGYPTQLQDAGCIWRRLSAVAPPRLPQSWVRIGGIEVFRDAHVSVLVDGDATAWYSDLDAGLIADSGREGLVVSTLLVALLVELAGHAGWYALHAAAVGRGESMVLLPAPSGGGKSTLFRRAAARGWELLSDDLVWLAPGGRLAAFPRGAPAAAAAAPTQPVGRAAAIVFPFVGGRLASRLRSVAPRETAARLLAASASLAVGTLRARRFGALAGLAALPAWELEAGLDGDAVLDLLDACLTTGVSSPVG